MTRRNLFKALFGAAAGIVLAPLCKLIPKSETYPSTGVEALMRYEQEKEKLLLMQMAEDQLAAWENFGITVRPGHQYRVAYVTKEGYTTSPWPPDNHAEEFQVCTNWLRTKRGDHETA